MSQFNAGIGHLVHVTHNGLGTERVNLAYGPIYAHNYPTYNQKNHEITSLGNYPRPAYQCQYTANLLSLFVFGPITPVLSMESAPVTAARQCESVNPIHTDKYTFVLCHFALSFYLMVLHAVGVTQA
jgi:hypothetical protein